MFYISNSHNATSFNHPEFKLLMPLISATKQSLLQIHQGLDTTTDDTLIKKNDMFYNLYSASTPSDYPLSFRTNTFLSFIDSTTSTDNYAITYDGITLKFIPNPSDTLLNQLISYANKQILIFNLYSSGPNSLVYTSMFNANNMDILSYVLKESFLIKYSIEGISDSLDHNEIGDSFEFNSTGIEVLSKTQLRLYNQGFERSYLINATPFLNLIEKWTTAPRFPSNCTRYIITIDNDTATLEYDDLHPAFLFLGE